MNHYFICGQCPYSYDCPDIGHYCADKKYDEEEQRYKDREVNNDQ